MFPHEAQATMAKFLFMLFAILLLLVSKVGNLKASEIPNIYINKTLAQANISH